MQLVTALPGSNPHFCQSLRHLNATKHWCRVKGSVCHFPHVIHRNMDGSGMALPAIILEVPNVMAPLDARPDYHLKPAVLSQH